MRFYQVVALENESGYVAAKCDNDKVTIEINYDENEQQGDAFVFSLSEFQEFISRCAEYYHWDIGRHA